MHRPMIWSDTDSNENVFGFDDTTDSQHDLAEQQRVNRYEYLGPDATQKTSKITRTLLGYFMDNLGQPKCSADVILTIYIIVKLLFTFRMRYTSDDIHSTLCTLPTRALQ